MRTEIQSKLIQYHKNYEQSEQGFTLIELLVVVLIVGILAAVALPNFLSQDVKAKQSEAKQNLTLVNKAQNYYRTEKSTFATSFDVLAIGTITGGTTGATNNFSYTLAASNDTATIIARPNDAILKGYSGGSIYYNNSASQSVIGTILCEVKSPGTTAPAPTTFAANSVTCTGLQTNLSI